MINFIVLLLCIICNGHYGNRALVVSLSCKHCANYNDQYNAYLHHFEIAGELHNGIFGMYY